MKGLMVRPKVLLLQSKNTAHLCIKDPLFADLWFKKSEGDGTSFKKLQIRIRQDIISDKVTNWAVNPNQTTGQYLTAEQLHEWIVSNKKILYCRHAQQLRTYFLVILKIPSCPKWKPSVIFQIHPATKKTHRCPIVTVCTGGIRCEKASGFLIQNGNSECLSTSWRHRYLYGKIPQPALQRQALRFSNQRILMGFNTNDPQHEIIGKCAKCSSQHPKTILICQKRHLPSPHHYL